MRRCCPELPIRGCLLLGKHYAHPARRCCIWGSTRRRSSCSVAFLDVSRQPYAGSSMSRRAAERTDYGSQVLPAVADVAVNFPSGYVFICCPASATWSGLSNAYRVALISELTALRQWLRIAARRSSSSRAARAPRPRKLSGNRRYPSGCRAAALGAFTMGGARRTLHGDRVGRAAPHFSRANSMTRSRMRTLAGGCRLCRYSTIASRDTGALQPEFEHRRAVVALTKCVPLRRVQTARRPSICIWGS